MEPFVEKRFEDLVAELGKTRVLELILKGQKWEISQSKRAQYMKDRLNDPEVGPRLKEQRKDYQKRRNEELKMIKEWYKEQNPQL